MSDIKPDIPRDPIPSSIDPHRTGVPGPSTQSARPVIRAAQANSARTSIARSAQTAALASRPVAGTRRPSNPATIQPNEWPCPTCTLLNPLQHLSCDACATVRPSEYSTNQPQPNLAPGTGKTGPDQTVFGVGGKGAGIGIAEGWFCGVCGEGPTSWERWSCEGCGVVRTFG